MTTLSTSGTFKLGDRTVHRMGYGAMQLAGPGVFGPPKDRGEAIKVLRAAVEAGVDHIDTCDYYGPYVVNEIIREALHPYPANLTLVTKVGARRDETGQWLPWNSPADLTQAIHDNLGRLGLDAIDAVNFRSMHGMQPTEGTIAPQVEALAELKRKGLIRHIGVSNVTPAQIKEAQAITPIVCVQNFYNVANRGDDAMVDALAKDGIAYVPFFPLGGFMPLQSSILEDVAKKLGATPLQTALAWLLRRSPNILLIPGTSSLAHLRENLAAAELKLPDDAMAALNGIGATAH
ncbi:MAG: aldo/keto reductase family oxidoreductase [Proteobacteria bacterium]|nr:aldo/keto reductase family oxidoreductase [Pseudomonadota bacterium]